MTGLERLLAEELPTGEWGGPRPAPGPAPTPAVLAAAHRAVLEAAVDGWRWDGDPRRLRHLRAVPDEPDEPGAGRRAA